MTFILILALHAGAGIRLIHGGGGYAEMKALSLHDRMPRLLRALKVDAPLDPKPLAFADEDPSRYLKLPAASLYDERKEPLPLIEIAISVYQAMTGHTREAAAHLPLLESLAEHALPLPDGSLHLLKLADETLVLRETDDGTIDLTPKMVTQLPCAPSFPAKFKRIEAAHVDNGVVIARVTFACGERDFTGRMILDPRDQAPILSVKAVAPIKCADGVNR